MDSSLARNSSTPIDNLSHIHSHDGKQEKARGMIETSIEDNKMNDGKGRGECNDLGQMTQQDS